MNWLGQCEIPIFLLCLHRATRFSDKCLVPVVFSSFSRFSERPGRVGSGTECQFTSGVICSRLNFISRIHTIYTNSMSYKSSLVTCSCFIKFF